MKFGLIGETLKHSYSKIIHEKFGTYKYDLVELSPSELERFVKSNDYDAYNVTIPYKQAIIPYLDEIDESARAIGSVNTVCRIKGKTYGYNTDFAGMLYMLAKANITITDKNVLILGSGGTCKTALAVCKFLSARSVTVVSRRGSVNYSNCGEIENVQAIINTTPVGMYPYVDVSLVKLDEFPDLEAVVDVIYNPLNTKLIVDAQKKGVKCCGGLSMLVAQAKYSMDLFTRKNNDDGLIENVCGFLSKRISNIVLIGMPGSGKSSIGKAIAKRTHKKYVDTDAEIVAAAKKSIPEIFEQNGEKYFREIERKVVSEIGKENGMVISTGGGAVLDNRNYYSLKSNGKIYFIDRDIDSLAVRNRPLSKSLDDLKVMKEKRLPLYEWFADVTIKNDGEFFGCVDKILEDYDNENIDNQRR